MAEALESGLGAAVPSGKKSLFSKSIWAKPAAQKEGIEFFSRADELWPSRLAEEERKRQKKATKLERKRSTLSAERRTSSTPDSKRRRVSQNEDDRHSSEGSLNHEDPDEASRARSRKSNSSFRQKPETPAVSLTERYSRDLHAKSQESSKKQRPATVYISLSDSDNEAGPGNMYGGNKAFALDDDDDDMIAIDSRPVPLIEDEANISDEEFPELARQARERAKQRELERLKAGRSFNNKNHDSFGSKTSVDIDDDIFEERPLIAEDPIVEIFVSSVIENTIPLRVQRKLSQTIHKVKLAWCDKQNFSGQPLQSSIQDNIFFTWKGIRLFDLTTCKSLGLKIDGSGHIRSAGEGFAEGKIHFEAWTQDLYDSSQRRSKAEKDASNEDEAEMAEQPVEKKLRLFLKAKDQQPMKIFVKPTTTFSKMVSAFRQSKDLPEEQQITLYFDGDKLDPNSMVEDVDLDDLDNIEVHVR
ncbi:hypothetical protein D0Z07_2607 [Hyphodiscus hymeniophilus]|uniref:Ubiquitin-like domain-containing protein n=1 Tax=Hyphodiscus hymeniophilus TaxID=353542 RepID=A0A9P6VP78_9HELO|nr:hypothetical protein D0Z07_2607 [Hyphodiscus hymeniophilus]